MSDGRKLLTIYLLTGPQSNRIGYYYLSPAAAAEDLNCSRDTLLKRLRNVCETFGWCFDDVNYVLWIRSWWKYNPPANPNLMVKALKDLPEVPKSPLFQQFAASDEVLPANLRETFAERLPLVSHQKQKQKQKQEQEQKIEEAASYPVRIPLSDGSEFPIPLEWIEEWRHAYPAVNLDSEIRKIRQWNLSDPKRRKTPRGIRRHLNLWLSKAQDRGPRAPKAAPSTERRKHLAAVLGEQS